MCLAYPIVFHVALLGSKTDAGVLTTEALTADYADNVKVISGTTGMSKLDIRYSYTTGTDETNNTLSIKVEESSDLVNWFRIPNEAASVGTSTLTARTFVNADNTSGATNIKGSVGLDIFYDNIRVSFLEGGVASNFGTIYAEATVLGR